MDYELWQKSWAEIKRNTIDRYIYTGMELIGGNDDHRTPADIFIQGDKLYIRSTEGILCMQTARP